VSCPYTKLFRGSTKNIKTSIHLNHFVFVLNNKLFEWQDYEKIYFEVKMQSRRLIIDMLPYFNPIRTRQLWGKEVIFSFKIPQACLQAFSCPTLHLE
jgi:hypothetical protein